MQATGTLHDAQPLRVFVIVVVAVLSGLAVGAAGGYAARGGSQAASAVTHSTLPAVHATQDHPDSDLTRAVPSAAPDATAQPAQPSEGLIP